MTIFANAILSILGSRLVLSFVGCSIPFLAVGVVCSVFHSGGDKF